MYCILEVTMFDNRYREFHGHRHPFDRRERLFHRGDMKYVILDLIQDKPSHGYEISLALEERSHGMYSPSAGSIYPVLQLLEDMGYVTSLTTEGKRVYTITDAGKKFLEDQQETIETIRGRFRRWWGPENREYVQDVRTTMHYARSINQLVRQIAVRRDPAKLTRVNAILDKTLKDIEEIHQEA
jgi:DNA-binding PadR family transcriptional regulator